MNDHLAELAARLGYTLDPSQLAAMGEAVAAAEPHAAALRGIPVRPEHADPAYGEAWLVPEWSGPGADLGSGSASRAGSGSGYAAGGSGSGSASRAGSGSGYAAGGSGSGSASRAGSDSGYAAGGYAAGAAGRATAEALRAAWGGRAGESADRLAALHERLNCTIRILRDRAPGTGALQGVPFAVKDVIDVAGVPTTAASLTRRDTAPAAESATVVARLEAVGAVPVSKDATTEFAVGGPHPPLTGACRNPWDPARWAGGSSTGTAAAVAAGVVAFGLGTDVGGSVRLPAAWCGLTGLKPTAGAVPRTGVVPLSWTTETVGPLARDAETVALVFDLIRGPDGRDPRCGERPPLVLPDVRGLRVAVPGGYLTELCDSAVRAGVDDLVAALVDAGATLVPGEIPSAERALPIGYEIVFTEAAALHRIDAERWSEYDPVTVRRISQGITTPASDYLRALQFRAELQRELGGVFAGADLVVVPTTPATAPRLPDCTVTVDGEQYPLYAAQSRATMLGNLTGAPGLAVPTGFAPDGLPVSALLIAPPHREGTALAAARHFQSVTDHHSTVPNPYV